MQRRDAIQAWRRGATATLTALALLWSPAAQAEWSDVRQVTLGTAQVLEQGAATFGVFSPLAYGITSKLTLQSHPIYDLLLVPNVAGRYRLVDRRSWVVSATASFQRSYFQVAQALPGEASPPAPGELSVGSLASWYPLDSLALTGGLLYANHIDKRVKDTQVGWAHGAAVSLQAHWLLRPEDLVQAITYLRWDFHKGGLDSPIVTLGWTRSLLGFLGGAHLLASISVGDVPQGLSDAPLRVAGVPFWPMIDLWWRM